MDKKTLTEDISHKIHNFLMNYFHRKDTPIRISLLDDVFESILIENMRQISDKQFKKLNPEYSFDDVLELHGNEYQLAIKLFNLKNDYNNYPRQDERLDEMRKQIFELIKNINDIQKTKKDTIRFHINELGLSNFRQET